MVFFISFHRGVFQENYIIFHTSQHVTLYNANSKSQIKIYTCITLRCFYFFNTFMPNVRMLSISFLFLPLVTYTGLVGDLCLSLSLFSSVFRVMEINDHVSDGLLFNISIPLDFYYINKEIRDLMNLMQTEDLIF